jgi:hypothetical protein
LAVTTASAARASCCGICQWSYHVKSQGCADGGVVINLDARTRVPKMCTYRRIKVAEVGEHLRKLKALHDCGILVVAMTIVMLY